MCQNLKVIGLDKCYKWNCYRKEITSRQQNIWQAMKSQKMSSICVSDLPAAGITTIYGVCCQLQLLTEIGVTLETIFNQWWSTWNCLFFWGGGVLLLELQGTFWFYESTNPVKRFYQIGTEKKKFNNQYGSQGIGIEFFSTITTITTQILNTSQCSVQNYRI